MNEERRARALVVSPLEFERRALRARGLEALCELQCCGPGPHAVKRWADGIGARRGLVILAGVAGALDPALAPGSAMIVTRVVDEGGESIAINISNPATSTLIESATVASTTATVTTPAAKAALFKRTGAWLVDMESASFVAAALRHSWQWLIIRGISDGAADLLPEHIDQWVDQCGRTRGWTIAKSILQSPLVLGSLLSLGRNSRRAMDEVARHIEMVVSPSGSSQAKTTNGGERPW